MIVLMISADSNIELNSVSNGIANEANDECLSVGWRRMSM